LIFTIQQKPNARINPPGSIPGTDKLTMKDKLIPVGLNELLGSPLDVTIQRALLFCPASLYSIRLPHEGAAAQRPN
jgi:hypothetical protein